MKITEFTNLLNSLGVPVACNRFTSPQSTPFLIYMDVGSENFGADNVTYFESINIDVEVYTDRIDDDLEDRIKKLFDDNGIYYDWSRQWISQEKIYQTTYEVTI